jgi:hypothetical protein
MKIGEVMCKNPQQCLAQSQLPKHDHAPRKELIGGGTYLEVKEEVPWGPLRQFPMRGRSSRRKFPG